MNARDRLLGAYRAALAAVDGRECVVRRLTEEPVEGPVHLVAVGKAAGPMTDGAVAVLGDAVAAGLVVHPNGRPPARHPRVTALASAHPVPDARSLAAGAAMMRFVDAAPADAHFLFLLSGGASSLAEHLAEGGTRADLAALNRRLLADGAPIAEINRVRRSVSLIKGGRLGARLRGRPATALLISDVRGDDPAVIGSGLLFPPPDRPSRPDDLPPAYAGLLPPAPPGPEAGDPALAGVRPAVLAGNGTALEAAAPHLRERGVSVSISPDFLDRDAVAEGVRVADALRAASTGAIVWGGEPTVVLPVHHGRGGRMHALALAAARRFEGEDGVTLLAAGTDGVDGNSGAAGAIVDGGTVARGRERGLAAADALADADAGSFLEAVGDQIVTGPTGTNVMDLVIGLRES